MPYLVRDSDRRAVLEYARLDHGMPLSIKECTDIMSGKMDDDRRVQFMAKYRISVTETRQPDRYDIGTLDQWQSIDIPRSGLRYKSGYHCVTAHRLQSAAARISKKTGMKFKVRIVGDVVRVTRIA